MARRLFELRSQPERPGLVIVNHTARPRRPAEATRDRFRQADGRIVEIVNLSDKDAKAAVAQDPKQK